MTLSGPDFDEATERLLQEGRPSAPLRPRGREAAAELLVGAAFLVAAIAMAPFHAMHRQAHLLQHLVRQFVDYTRLKAGRQLAINPQPSPIAPIVEQVAAIQAETNPIELDLPNDLPQAQIDPDRFRQVLMNLTSNAVEFSPPGSPPRIVARSEGEAVEVAVIDRGRGIGPEERSHLSEEFHRGDAEPRPGSGVGLYLSRVLMESQGVRIEVHSEPGEGSSFTLVIPRAN